MTFESIIEKGSRVIWLVGASGIGKTFHGRTAAARLGLPFLQLDRFRDISWADESTRLRLSGTPFRSCRDYVDARTRAVRNVDDFLLLHAVIGETMVLRLRDELTSVQAPSAVVEASLNYGLALPQDGIRLRMHVSRDVHERNLRLLRGLSFREASVLCAFLRDVESSALVTSRVRLHVPVTNLESTLRGIQEARC
jgi:hypothetical protein